MVQRPVTATAILTLLSLLMVLGTAAPTPAQKSQPPQPPTALDLLDQQLPDVIDATRASVVSIRGQMRRTLPGPRSIAQSVLVTGTGFLLPNGIVVTTAEVVANITNPSVIFPDGLSVRATAMGYEARPNIAVLRIKTKRTEPGLHWGDSTKVRAGNFAITIGVYSGFTDSAALGFISNPHQKAMSSKDGRHYDSLIQFQGAVGGGGIGSPLLNLHGEVIGMVIGMAVGPSVDSGNARSRLLASSNMGFAIPSATIRELLDGIIQNARPLPEAGWFGFRPVKDSAEPVIGDIYINSPAEHAGILVGDIILTVDDEPIKTSTDLKTISEQLSVGQKVRIELRRGDKILPLELQITPKPDNPALKPDDPNDKKKREQPPRVGSATDEILFYHPLG